MHPQQHSVIILVTIKIDSLTNKEKQNFLDLYSQRNVSNFKSSLHWCLQSQNFEIINIKLEISAQKNHSLILLRSHCKHPVCFIGEESHYESSIAGWLFKSLAISNLLIMILITLHFQVLFRAGFCSLDAFLFSSLQMFERNYVPVVSKLGEGILCIGYMYPPLGVEPCGAHTLWEVRMHKSVACWIKPY